MKIITYLLVDVSYLNGNLYCPAHPFACYFA